MTNIPHVSEPRSRTVLRNTRRAIDDGRLKVLPFSERVAARYFAEVQVEDRTVPFRVDGETAETALAARKHNHKFVDRLLKGEIKTFPADLEDAWVAELPEEHRERCVRELAARRGLVAVADPRVSDAPVVQGGELSDLLREVGASAAALAPIFADGRVDEADMPHIGAALDQLGALLTATLQIHQRMSRVVTEAAGKRSSNVLAMRGRA